MNTRSSSSPEIDFLAELQNDEQYEKRCGLKAALLEMEDGYLEQVVEALKDSRWSSASIARTLKKHGYRVNEWQIRRCRKNCECGALR